MKIQSNEVSFEELLAKARRHWRFVVAGAGIGAVIAVTYTLVVPPIYEARAALVLPLPDEQQPEMLAGGGLLSKQSALTIYLGIFQSYSVRSRVAKAANISLKDLDKMLMCMTDENSNQIIISSQSTSKKDALNIVDTTLKTGSNVLASTSFSKAERQEQALETAVAKKQDELENAEEALNTFQKSSKTIANLGDAFAGTAVYSELAQNEIELGAVKKELDVAKQLATRVALGDPIRQNVQTLQTERERLREQLAQKQVELGFAQVSGGAQAPNVLRLQEEVKILKDALAESGRAEASAVAENRTPDLARLEIRQKSLEWRRDQLLKRANLAGDEAITLLRLLRTHQLAKTGYEALYSQYEQARTSAGVERVRWSVIDRPYIEPEPVNKRPARNAAIGFVLGSLLSVALVARRSKADSKRR
jgi:uncharacterized protein involved in exopolysaccharide biosynthesis